jgi:AraC family transcriptional regulator
VTPSFLTSAPNAERRMAFVFFRRRSCRGDWGRLLEQPATAPHATEAKGAFGDTLAAYYHQSESKTAAVAWPERSTFAITRLHSNAGLPGTSRPIPEEQAIHVSIAIKPVPLGSYELSIDDRGIDVPYIPAFRTSIIDLQSRPLCQLDCGFDYVHYHIPREGLDEIARDHRIKPVGSYKFAICEDDLVIAQLTKNILPFAGSRDWSSLLALDQFSLMFGAHLLQTYGGLSRLPEVVTRGLAPWQMRRAAEVLREHLDGGVHLGKVAQECGMSVSHFARSFRASFGVSAHRWLVLRRIDRSKELLLNTRSLLVEVALQSGFPDQAAFNRTFRQIVGDSPGRWRREHAGR